jgi:hypothetical protein
MISSEFKIIDDHLLDSKPVRVASNERVANKNLLEIFNWYSLKFLLARAVDFDSMQQNLSYLSLQGFACFCSEFKVPLDPRSITEVYKRSQVNN